MSIMFCAQDGTRTCTPKPAPAPQAGVSTNFTTWAFIFRTTFGKRFMRPGNVSAKLKKLSKSTAYTAKNISKYALSTRYSLTFCDLISHKN